jgi:hypothetical protein
MANLRPIDAWARRMDQHDEITFGVLSAIDADQSVTQRKIALSLGIALGLTNAYLRHCARKGLIKVEQVPVRRYAYYLTRKGFAEKSRLTAEYLASSLDFFRRARRECTKLLSYAKTRAWHRVALVGGGDLAEVAVLSASEVGIRIVAIIDPSRSNGMCVGRPIVSDLESLRNDVDALIFTSIDEPQLQYDIAVKLVAAAGFPEDRLLLPEFLRLKRRLQIDGSTEAASP